MNKIFNRFYRAYIMDNKRILIVEDEKKIARFVELELKYEGYEVEMVHDGRSGLERAIEGKFDLVLLDVMLPELNGMEVCRRIRHSSQIPIIMLTAKDEVTDKVMGLDIGADDYVTKPFAIEELLARIRSALKRRVVKETGDENFIKVKNLKLDLNKYIASYESETIDLTKKEFELIRYLMENKNIVMTRERILEKVWGYDYIGDTNIVDVYVSYLRSKIDQKYKEKYIHTVRGVGYILKDE